VSVYLTVAGILFVYMTAWFFVSLVRRRNDVADVAWGLGFVLVAWSSHLLSASSGVRGMIVAVVVSIWGLRLAWHIYMRNRGKAEDYRYLAWRKEWGAWFYPRSYAQVFLLQGVLLFLIAIPVMIIEKSTATPLGLFDAAGIIVWLIGFYFESVGDRQLALFIKDPANKGQLMQRGLWAYTRHPNYFGEVTQWWGIWLIALSVPGGLIGIIGPITITILILKVSGIPLLEKKMAEHPQFADYKRRTSMFFPLPPRTARD
jgi:steroid 5-alpha reductase family enzyme